MSFLLAFSCSSFQTRLLLGGGIDNESAAVGRNVVRGVVVVAWVNANGNVPLALEREL
jgi:hypothetical protein